MCVGEGVGVGVGVCVSVSFSVFSVIHVGVVVGSVHLVCVSFTLDVLLYVHSFFGANDHFLSRVCWRY